MGAELKGPEVEFPIKKGEHGDSRFEDNGPEHSPGATQFVFQFDFVPVIGVEPSVTRTLRKFFYQVLVSIWISHPAAPSRIWGYIGRLVGVVSGTLGGLG
jgi:hypothetical protein